MIVFHCHVSSQEGSHPRKRYIRTYFCWFDRQGEFFFHKKRRSVVCVFLVFAKFVQMTFFPDVFLAAKHITNTRVCFLFAGFVVDDEVDQRGLKSSLWCWGPEWKFIRFFQQVSKCSGGVVDHLFDFLVPERRPFKLFMFCCCVSLGIQSPCQMMIGVYSHLLRKVFRFQYHSQKVIGSLGYWNESERNPLCSCLNRVFHDSNEFTLQLKQIGILAHRKSAGSKAETSINTKM